MDGAPSEATDGVRDEALQAVDLSDAIPTLVERLRLVRLVSQQRRYSGRPVPRLPSKPEIIAILGDIVGLLYPRHFGPPGLTAETTDAYVAQALVSVGERLSHQLEAELMLALDADPQLCHSRARREVKQFLNSLIQVRDLHDTDIVAAFQGDPSAKSLDEVAFCFPGPAAILRHRIAHQLYKLGATMIARIMAEYSHSVTGIDIHPGAKIGAAFFIDHGTGVVIGETAEIGRNVRLYQQVTLGAKRFVDDGNGGLVKGQPRHPVIEDDVVIYAGATLLGRIRIGQGAVVGGGVWLTESLPPHSTVTQAPPEQHLSTKPA